MIMGWRHREGELNSAFYDDDRVVDEKVGDRG